MTQKSYFTAIFIGTLIATQTIVPMHTTSDGDANRQAREGSGPKRTASKPENPFIGMNGQANDYNSVWTRIVNSNDPELVARVIAACTTPLPSSITIENKPGTKPNILMLNTLLRAGISIKLEQLNARIDAQEYNISNGKRGYFSLQASNNNGDLQEIPIVLPRGTDRRQPKLLWMRDRIGSMIIAALLLCALNGIVS